MDFVLDFIEQGFIYAIIAFGVYITYSILDFPDLTVDSSFPLGAAVGVLLIKNGVNPYLALPAAFLAGGISGLATGVIHAKFGVRDLLSGIITMTMLYSINHQIAGTSNVPLMNDENIFTLFNKAIEAVLPQNIASSIMPFSKLILIFIIMMITKILFDLYMKTKSGYLLRAVGDNEAVVATLAKNSGTVKIIGLVIANALVALAGCVMLQDQRYFDIGMGTGTIVIGLASVIIGINVFGKLSFIKGTTAVILGSVAYKACVAAAIEIGLPPSFLKLVIGALFLIILIVGNFSKKGAEK